MREFIDQLADVWSATVQLGRDLGPQDWAAPTECPGWTVQDHVAHVVGTESFLLGRPAPPPADGGAHVRNALGEINEAWVAPRRAPPGRAVLAELEEVTAARLAALRVMTDEELQAPTPSPLGQVPYEQFMSLRVMDCWVHEQDIRQALGLAWRLHGPAAPAAIDRLTQALGYVVGKKVAPPDGTVLVVAVDGPVARRLALTVRHGRGGPAPSGATADATVTVTDEVYVRLAAGRLPPARALADGLVAVTGDRALGEALVTALPHVP